ncbi:hypothetical protein KCTC52924_03541 [Arenibacter antarcticus]|uniref:PA2169 family four-helix-bundle protein n=1 Tax=Arenibacter antarcticus TaxID=2040469 RepID=A0ABW5VHN6_9FLAO|nr:PA2169 family four-helix-bundle protein [Arenibacter sp. H213]MCM4166601.1 hypothetical protein [Arenibacter sp. H213]
MIHLNIDNEYDAKIAIQLYGVILKNKESKNAYCKAMERAVSADLKTYFQDKFTKYKRFDETLAREVSVAFPQLLPVAWRNNNRDFWIDTETIFRLSDDASMLKACIQGDRAAVREYADLLEKYSLPFDVYHVIRKHKMFIEVDLHKVSKIKDLY